MCLGRRNDVTRLDRAEVVVLPHPFLNSSISFRDPNMFRGIFCLLNCPQFNRCGLSKVWMALAGRFLYQTESTWVKNLCHLPFTCSSRERILLSFRKGFWAVNEIPSGRYEFSELLPISDCPSDAAFQSHLRNWTWSFGNFEVIKLLLNEFVCFSTVEWPCRSGRMRLRIA